MRLLRIILSIYLIAFVAFIALMRLAAPGPTGQTIQGVRIGAWKGDAHTAYFTGKRLRCEPAQPASTYTELCRIDIAGQELMLSGRLRQDGEPQMTARGACAAEYAGQTWACELQSHSNYPAAAVAYITGGLDLDAAQLADVRRRFPIENTPETTIVRTLLALWPVTAVALIVTVLTSWPKARRGKVIDGIAIALFGLAVIVGLPLLLLIAARGFVD
jgi:hypothetical protein